MQEFIREPERLLRTSLNTMEVMPNAIQLMAKAAQDAGLSVNGTVAELMKLMEQGKVASDVILPHFAKRLHEAASANGGLEKAMNSNRAAMARLITSSQEAANEFFVSEMPIDALKTNLDIGKLGRDGIAV